MIKIKVGGLKTKVLLTIFLIFLTNFCVLGELTNLDSRKKIIEDDESYDLLIINPRRFSSYLKDLKTHKEKYGIKTNISNVENICNDSKNDGKDKAEKIKYFIRDELETHQIKYVLLVGGRKTQLPSETWWIPVRYSYLSRPYGNYSERKFLTDLYFADIYDSEGNFSTWDDDNDSVFGEWPVNESAVDRPDLLPDVSVGRLTCRTIFDVKIAVNKIIKYETSPISTKDWFKKMVLVAGDTYPDKTPDFIDGEEHTNKSLRYMSGFEPIKIYGSKDNLNWLNIVTSINRGCGFVFYSGHGGPNLWGTHPPFDSEKWIGYFKLRHMPFLLNFNKLPVCLSASGCFNNMFNVSLTHSEWVYFFGIPGVVPRCWGETLVLKPLGGSIATIASTAFSYESSDIDRKVGGCEWLDIHFFEEYNSSKNHILGECWSNTITRFLQNFSINWDDNAKKGDALIAKNVEQWLLIGDPSLKIGGYN